MAQSGKTDAGTLPSVSQRGLWMLSVPLVRKQVPLPLPGPSNNLCTFSSLGHNPGQEHLDGAPHSAYKEACASPYTWESPGSSAPSNKPGDAVTTFFSARGRARPGVLRGGVAKADPGRGCHPGEHHAKEA